MVKEPLVKEPFPSWNLNVVFDGPFLCTHVIMFIISLLCYYHIFGNYQLCSQGERYSAFGGWRLYVHRLYVMKTELCSGHMKNVYQNMILYKFIYVKIHLP